MALYITNTVKIKPGHIEEFLAWVPNIVPIYVKYGVKFHGAFQAVGGEANSAVYLVSVPDFAASGDMLETIQADAQFQAAQKEGGNHIDGNVIQMLMPIPGSAMQ